PNGNVEYSATCSIVKPVDMSLSSGLMWHDVPNRGGRITITPDLRNSHDVGLSSGWQGDNAGATVVPANASALSPVTPSNNEWVKTPVLAGVQGQILARIINRSGLGAQPLNVMGNPDGGGDRRGNHPEQRLEILRRWHVRGADAGHDSAGPALPEGRF